jgi:hypothetical protein
LQTSVHEVMLLVSQGMTRRQTGPKPMISQARHASTSSMQCARSMFIPDGTGHQGVLLAEDQQMFRTAQVLFVPDAGGNPLCGTCWLEAHGKTPTTGDWPEYAIATAEQRRHGQSDPSLRD